MVQEYETGFMRDVKEKFPQISYISLNNPQIQKVLMQVTESKVHKLKYKVKALKSSSLCHLWSLLSGKILHGYSNTIRRASWPISNQLRHLVPKGGTSPRNNQLK